MISITQALALRESRSDVTTLANPAAWLLQWAMGGTEAAQSGVSVTERNALQMSIVWACIRVIAEDVAKVRLDVLKEVGQGERQPMHAHPLQRMLNAQPNSEMTALVFRETLTAHATSWGNGYAEIERNGAGRPVALWPMTPDRVGVRRVYSGNSGNAARSWIVYDFLDPFGKPKTGLPAEDVLHIRGLGFDGLVGYSVINMARQSLGLVKAAEMFGAGFFSRAARPSGVLEHPKALSKLALANLRESFKKLYTGPENAGTPMILEEGMKWQNIGLPPNDAQFIETRQFGLPEGCRWFRVPPHKIFDLSRATFSNIEHSSIEYVDDSLGGWMRRWEQELAAKCLTMDEQASGICLEHDETDLKRGDKKSSYDAYAVGRQWGWLSANDIRRMEGMNPVAGGDAYLTPVNMAAAGLDANSPKGQRDAIGRRVKGLEPVVLRFAPILAQHLGRCLKVETDRARRALAKQPAADLSAWSADFYGEHFDHVRGEVFPVMETLMRAVDAIVQGELRTPEINKAVAAVARRHCEQSRQEFAGITERNFEATVAAWDSKRADDQAELELRRLLTQIAELNQPNQEA